MVRSALPRGGKTPSHPGSRPWVSNVVKMRGPASTMQRGTYSYSYTWMTASQMATQLTWSGSLLSWRSDSSARVPIWSPTSLLKTIWGWLFESRETGCTCQWPSTSRMPAGSLGSQARHGCRSINPSTRTAQSCQPRARPSSSLLWECLDGSLRP